MCIIQIEQNSHRLVMFVLPSEYVCSKFTSSFFDICPLSKLFMLFFEFVNNIYSQKHFFDLQIYIQRKNGNLLTLYLYLFLLNN